MLRKLMAVLVVIAVVLTALPAHAAPTAEDRGDALVRLADWMTELVGHLAVLVGAAEAGPNTDPTGGTLVGDPTTTEADPDPSLDTTVEGGAKMDPHG